MQAVSQKNTVETPTIYRILFAISFGHFLNDSMQAVVPALFPILEKTMNLSYMQVGWIAFALNMTSSIMQPVFGMYSDKKPSPFLLPLGMFSSMLGMIGLAFAPNFIIVIISVLFIGLGSAVFHPEGARVAYMAAGAKRGLAQAIYQVGGNTGNSLAPIFTALIFVPLGQIGSLGFTAFAAVGIALLIFVSNWYKNELATGAVRRKKRAALEAENAIVSTHIKFVIILLVFLTFVRSWYGAGIGNFYQFYLIEHYGLSIKNAQYFVFAFMIAGVLGTFFGGPLADRFGKKNIIVFSMLGSAPLALLLPHVSLVWVVPLFLCIGFISSSSFSVIVVYAQELVPGKVGMVSGLIVGLAFGLGALGAVVLGKLADIYSLQFIMILCSCLPLIGLTSWLLPSDKKTIE
ncbi:TPA: MFS transporter [Bacillus thuringiensis]|uniref:Fosmidomycin resistance protein n=9 Tax=Bacillus cereus group TaxID=86661 RepID=A0A9X7B7K8_BACCE|nr:MULTISPECIES: MFS transporter [Bacillus]MCU7389105.1 MFS transporter [Bacillus sp. ST24]NIE89334.1 MFS transporter [Bacillus sp. Ab-1751]OUB28678.1 MFS transporter [Bacillus thuringiensis serovar yunnanensis]QQP81289.1 MFS transporter [Bacillus sp. TK-2]CGG55447.1 Fosmidomycin resistance protein [Streptococcus pneumoniae]BCA36169.1 MFS transporter [Bacillus wiedmannii]HCF52874.1 MFS transporter [Bacillus sp. (in: firmicutes)]